MVIRRETLQAVKPATTDTDTRYPLASIQVEPDGTCVATNGHILIKAVESGRLEDSDYPAIAGIPEPISEPTAPILLPAETADRLCKATPKRSTIEVLRAVRVVANGDGSAYAMATDLTAPMVAKLTPDDPPQKFPNYAAVIPPADRPTVAIALGVPVLEVLLKSAKAAQATSIRLDLPTEARYQGRTPNTELGHTFNPRASDRDRCLDCEAKRAAHEKPNGVIETAIVATYGGDSVKAIAVMMPVRL